MQLDPQGVAPEDLSHAGSIVDKAIEYMMDQKVAPISAASALLGGALGLLARSMDDRAIAAVSLREIVQAAGQGNQSAIHYHFQDRQGLLVAVSDRVWNVFAPRFDAALAEANNTRYGLAASLVAQDPRLYDRFWAGVRAGVINWNRPTNGAPSNAPFGGVGRSGMGAYHGKAGFDAFSHQRTIVGSDLPFSITGSASPPFTRPMKAYANIVVRLARRRTRRRLRAGGAGV